MSSLNSPPGNLQKFWTPWRIITTLIVVTLLSLLGLSSCSSNDRTSAPANMAAPPASSRATRPAVITNAAPPVVPQELRDTKVETLDGQSLKLSDYNNKVVVVNIWATWCGPCRLEMPELIKMNNEYKAKGLVVLGLATTYNEQNDPVHVKDYLRTHNVNYKVLWDNGTLAGPLVQLVNARAVIPQSFVISRDGRIVKHFEGFSPLNTPQLMREAIEAALNNKG